MLRPCDSWSKLQRLQAINDKNNKMELQQEVITPQKTSTSTDVLFYLLL